MTKIIDKKEFAKSVLDCSPALWCQVLNGTRNFGNDNAGKASLIFGNDKDVWRNPARKGARLKAWNKYLKKISKPGGVKQ